MRRANVPRVAWTRPPSASSAAPKDCEGSQAVGAEALIEEARISLFGAHKPADS